MCVWCDKAAKSGVELAPGLLLPVSRNYYQYFGSLTSPPCTEGVNWIIIKQPVRVSQEQVSWQKERERERGGGGG